MSYPSETSVDPDTNTVSFYWVSRDRRTDGQLSDTCDLWFVRPIRERLGDHAVVWHTRDVAPDGVSLVGHVGEYTLDVIKNWCLTYPDDDRMLLVVGRT